MALLEERRERLECVDRVALVVEKHVRRIEVDANAWPVEYFEEEPQCVGGFLPSLEAKRDAVGVKHIGDLCDAVEQFGKAGVALFVRQEAGVEGDNLQAKPVGDCGDGLNIGPVRIPVFVRHNATGFADGIERRVIFADRAEHSGDGLDALGGE